MRITTKFEIVIENIHHLGGVVIAEGVVNGCLASEISKNIVQLVRENEVFLSFNYPAALLEMIWEILRRALKMWRKPRSERSRIEVSLLRQGPPSDHERYQSEICCCWLSGPVKKTIHLQGCLAHALSSQHTLERLLGPQWFPVNHNCRRSKPDTRLEVYRRVYGLLFQHLRLSTTLCLASEIVVHLPGTIKRCSLKKASAGALNSRRLISNPALGTLYFSVQLSLNRLSPQRQSQTRYGVLCVTY